MGVAKQAVPNEYRSAKATPSFEDAADRGSAVVDRAELGLAIECDTGAVAVLIHAAETGMFHHEIRRYVVARLELNKQPTTGSTTCALRNFGGQLGHRSTLARRP